jgi:quinohemoprotein ethanol dehydrogenase
LLAWDPVKQKEVWRVQYQYMWNSGTLTTAGNLVWQGTADGRVVAYSADKGEKLWEFNVGIGIIGSPITYQIDGVQYVSIMAGWGGAYALIGGYSGLPNLNVKNVGRVLTFALGGKQTLAALPPQTPSLTPIASSATPEMVAQGQLLYAQWCGVCHGVAAGGGGVHPSLPVAKPAVFQMYKEIVLDGAYANRGMPGFDKYLSPGDVEAIRAYIIQRRKEMAETKPVR